MKNAKRANRDCEKMVKYDTTLLHLIVVEPKNVMACTMTHNTPWRKHPKTIRPHNEGKTSQTIISSFTCRIQLNHPLIILNSLIFPMLMQTYNSLYIGDILIGSMGHTTSLKWIGIGWAYCQTTTQPWRHYTGLEWHQKKMPIQQPSLQLAT